MYVSWSWLQAMPHPRPDPTISRHISWTACSNQLQKLLKEFEQNAALTGILERRRRQEERMQYELQGREGMRALEMNRTPALRAGMAPIATSARVAAAIAELPPVPPPVDAAAVITGQRRRRKPAERPELAPPVEVVPGETAEPEEMPRSRTLRNVIHRMKIEQVVRRKANATRREQTAGYIGTWGDRSACRKQNQQRR